MDLSTPSGTVTRSADYMLLNKGVSYLDGLCADGFSTDLISTCSGQDYRDDWAVYEFTVGSCSTSSSFTLLSGNTVVLTEACSNLYPATISGTVACPTTNSPTPSPTATPSPTPFPSAYPTPDPTPSPTPFPTAYPTAYPTASPTAYPTASPTASPTPFPTPFPTPGPTPSPTYPPGSPLAAGAGGVAATGDPHLQNIHGERFDLMKPGKHVLINIPRGMTGEDAFLRVQADV